MSQTLIQSKSLGIPGAPPSFDMLLNGAIYAAILDSVPAHLSIMFQALTSNISAGNTCVLVTRMTPDEFLSRAATSGVDFSEDIRHDRLYLFSPKGDYTSNIFRRGIKRLLQEFDYFGVPKGSFFLVDQAEDLFTLTDDNIAQTQAMDYRDWMKLMENTSLFLFHARSRKRAQSILGCFSGVAQIIQSKTGIELLVDFWYAQDGAMAAKAFPVSLDTTGLIRVEPALSQAADEVFRSDSGSYDHNTVFYFGPDFAAFSASIRHTGIWIHAQTLVELIHLSRDASSATIVISLDSNADLQQTARIVHCLRLDRGNRLRIVIRESGFSLRYMNELFLLRFGANLIIHQQIAKQQLSLLWEMLAGQTYSRRVNKNFDLSLFSMQTSSYKGYVDLVTFCNESLRMFERKDILDIPLVLIIARFHEQASPPDILSQIKVVRNGDVFSSDAAHCYIFIHACEEENSAAALSRITQDKQASLFLAIQFITAKDAIRGTLQSLVQSGKIAVAPDFSDAILQLNRAYKPAKSKKHSKILRLNKAVKAPPASPSAAVNVRAAASDADEHRAVPVEKAPTAGAAAIEQPVSPEAFAEAEAQSGNLSSLMNRLTSIGTFSEGLKWLQK